MWECVSLEPSVSYCPTTAAFLNSNSPLSSASIIAPPVGGFLLDLNVAFPTYASAVAFFFGAGCAFALPFESAADLEALEKSSGDTYTLLD